MSRVMHFEIHAEDLGRAQGFYSGVFGWEFTPWGPPGQSGAPEYLFIKTGPSDQPGIDGGMIRRHGPIDGQAVIAYVCTINVDSLDETLAKIEQHGGQNVVAKMPVMGIGWLAYCKDTEGNIFGIMQMDSSAGNG